MKNNLYINPESSVDLGLAPSVIVLLQLPFSWCLYSLQSLNEEQSSHKSRIFCWAWSGFFGDCPSSVTFLVMSSTCSPWMKNNLHINPKSSVELGLAPLVIVLLQLPFLWCLYSLQSLNEEQSSHKSRIFCSAWSCSFSDCPPPVTFLILSLLLAVLEWRAIFTWIKNLLLSLFWPLWWLSFFSYLSCDVSTPCSP